MEYKSQGKIIRGIGGLYTVKLISDGTPLSDLTVNCRARGSLRSGDNRAHTTEKLLVGDNVEIVYTDASFTHEADGSVSPVQDAAGLPDAAVCAVLPRKNALIRPPMANLDLLFIVCASSSPAPDTETIDKLLSVAEYHGIECAVIVGKKELDPCRADELISIYFRAGYPVFAVSCATGEGIDELSSYVLSAMPGKTAAFAGASGVGKSTLISTLFPHLELESGEISRKISRGKHTTRRVELFPSTDGGMLADTPGFSLIDFLNFDFFPFDALIGTMREFDPHLDGCRYDDCTHTKEEGCAVLDAVRRGVIAGSRHESYLAMYSVLKNKHPWDNKNRK